MNTIKTLRWMVIVLLMLNALVVWLWLFSGKPRGRREEPKYYIIKALELDAAQQNDYEKLIHWHQAQMHSTRQQLMSLKNKLYATLNQNDTSKTLRDSLIRAISIEQENIEQINYKHFQDIKRLCRPEQLLKFNQLTSELSKLFSPQPPKPPKK